MNFGLSEDFNIYSDLEAVAEKEKNKIISSRENVKLTNAQARDALFEEIANLIKEDAHQDVINIIKDNPKISFRIGAVEQIKSALMNNFNEELFVLINERSMCFDYSFFENPLKYGDMTVLNTLFKLIKKHYLSENERYIEAVNNNQEFVPEPNSKINNLRVFEYSLQNCFSESLKRYNITIKEEKREEYKKINKLILNFFNQINKECEEMFNDNSHRLNKIDFFNNYTSLIIKNYSKTFSKEDKEDINNLKSDWAKEFVNFFDMILHNNKQLNALTFKSIIDICDDFPEAKDAWNKVSNIYFNNSKIRNSYIQRIWEKNEDINNSFLYKLLKKSKVSNYYNFDINKLNTNNYYLLGSVEFKNSQLLGYDAHYALSFFEDLFFSVEIFNEKDKELGNEFLKFMFNDNNVDFNFDRTRNLKIYVNENKINSKYLLGNSTYHERYLSFRKNPENIVELLVYSGFNAINVFFENKSNEDLIIKTIKKPYILKKWLSKVSVDDFYNTVKSNDFLKNYRDEFGNNLGMIYAVINKCNTKSFVQTFARIDHKWFDDKNTAGNNFHEILRVNSASQETLNFAEKEHLHRELKSDGLIPRKSKKTVQSKKRRM